MSHLLPDGFPQHFEYGAMLEVWPHTATSMAVDLLSCSTSTFSFMIQSVLLIMTISHANSLNSGGVNKSQL